jgi:hypothetical protein
MRSHEATAVIQAEPEAVWTVLIDGAAWSTWDSGVDAVEGRIAPGVVSTMDPPHRLVFTGGMPLGLFRGVRTYTLTPDGQGATGFGMREEFSGPLLPLIGRSIPDLQPSFTRFAEGLKKRVESGG